MTDLKTLRDQIDLTDREIVRCIEKRMELVEQVADDKLKTGRQVLDTGREAEKLAALKDQTDTAFNRTAVQEVFRLLMSISRKRQYQILTEQGRNDSFAYSQVDAFDFSDAKVVYQGVEGAYSFGAMSAFFPESIQSFHVKTWKEAMRMVASGEADYGVLPIENSTAGSVSDIYDLMLEYPNYMIGEKILKIDHKLMAPKGASLDTIRTVYSHPQALAQCRRYLEKHPSWKSEQMLNTAAAAQKIAEDGDITQAAIASEYAARNFGLDILTNESLSWETNSTRFIIISARGIFRSDAKKISICFELPHRCGTLYTILSHFIFNQLNMTRIESRPIPGQPWEYRFFVDFEGNLQDPPVRNALFGIQAETTGLRFLGNY